MQVLTRIKAARSFLDDEAKLVKIQFGIACLCGLLLDDADGTKTRIWNPTYRSAHYP